MALTITNTNQMTLLNILNRNNANQANTLKMLSTGKRINSGKDDPAGLIALSSLNSELSSVDAALTSNQRTDSILNVADAAIGEVQTLLDEVHTLAAEAASSGNLTNAEIAANQSQIDDALAAIDRIVSTTNFNGKKLLDGSNAIDLSGASTNANLDNIKVFSRSNSSSDTSITVTRRGAAATANVTLAGMSGTARTSGTTEIVIGGSLGTATVALASGMTRAEVVSQINQSKDQTGVSAMDGTTNVQLSSTSYGSDEYITVSVLSGGEVNSSYGTATSDGSTANNFQTVGKTLGTDADVIVNGQTVGVDGLDVAYNGNGTSLSFTLDESWGTTAGTGSTTFTVKASGGATFQLGTSTSTRATIGIDSLGTYNLGGGNGTSNLSEVRSGGTVDLNTDVAGALNSIEDAISQVAVMRGRLGGFQKFQVGTAISSLQTSQTSLTEAASTISDTDFAMATAKLNQETVLVNSSVSLMGLVNNQSAQLLSLLG